MKTNKQVALLKTPALKLSFCNKIIALEQEIGSSLLHIARDLKIIRDNRLYEGQWSSFDEYISEFRNLAPSTASRIITVYEVFVEKYKIPIKKLAAARGWTHLYAVAGGLKNKEDAVAWLEKATELTRSDLQKEVTESKTGVAMRDCKHKNGAYIFACPDCGDRERVSSLPDDVIPRENYTLGSWKGAKIVLITDDKVLAQEARDALKTATAKSKPDGLKLSE